ncbi:Ribonuclease R winged-helix domain-containing protein [Thermanaeromonas toyohensis ToBE]|uniref:Ribonuclease R winged-helix domain-containing protein n=1 Tax=Thermanaeromonas toyohensis ToBE TaxID=698762 RepID=A0A1W1VX94_9FIRM|nr:hypothetical protein [Thermanaeromonas toyohensis]SMB97975.1 Ribonuclease R winged-helix domain-containing protein [Thermanaeromonas toyohensis ToBE]
MPVGYSARCKVCNSPHRAEIEKWIKEGGVSAREVARRLAEMGEKISHEAIRRHMLEHFDVAAEAREQYRKSQKQFDLEVKKRLSDIEMLDATIADNFELSQATTAWLKELLEERKKPPLALVQLREKLQSEMRQAMKTKLELLGEDGASKMADALSALMEDLAKHVAGEGAGDMARKGEEA